MEELNSIAVIGAGTMGNGIAHLFASKNFPVLLVDTNTQNLEAGLSNIKRNLERQVQKGTIDISAKETALSLISTSSALDDKIAKSDLIIEAATENEEVKLNIFRTLDQLCHPTTVFASNTSSISITRIAAVTKRPGKVIGMHFMNPVPIMPLVEVINGYGTDKEVLTMVMSLARKLGKTPVEVHDYPGFVANRILMPMINEAVLALQEGVGGVVEIDTVMKLGMSHPMGPLELADFIGLDVCLSILRVLQSGTGNPKYAPSTLLVNMVEAGKRGIKTGEGFYKYKEGSKEKSCSFEIFVRSRYAVNL